MVSFWLTFLPALLWVISSDDHLLWQVNDSEQGLFSREFYHGKDGKQSKRFNVHTIPGVGQLVPICHEDTGEQSLW